MPRNHQEVFTITGLTRKRGNRESLKAVWLAFFPGAKIGVIGRNGSAKTLLLNMIIGQEAPASGTLCLGPTVQLGYVDPSRDARDPDKTLLEAVSGGQEHLQIGGRRAHARACVSRASTSAAPASRNVSVTFPVGCATDSTCPGACAGVAIGCCWTS